MKNEENSHNWKATQALLSSDWQQVSPPEILALIDQGANVNMPYKGGYTPLMLACCCNNTKVAQALLENGANVNIQETAHHMTALMFAAVNGNTELIKSLVNYKVDTGARDENGKTAAILALMCSQYDAVQMLNNPKALLKKCGPFLRCGGRYYGDL